jgi:prefoldin alpha subunit
MWFLFGFRGFMVLMILLQTAPKAVAFYDDKVKGLEQNLQELEKIVQAKSTQLRVVEESEFIPCILEWLFNCPVFIVWCANRFAALRQKLLAGEGAPPQAAAAG